MNLQEREQLSAFLLQLTQAQAGPKDGEAEALIKEASARQPDAVYLLVQRALLLDHALQQAQAEVSRLQNELAQSRQAGQAQSSGFLSGNSWGHSAAASAPVMAAPVAQAAPLQAPLQAAAAPAGGGWGSTLGTVATTAAGVAAGAFLFQGIGHLFNGSQHGSGWMPSAGAAPLDRLTENTVINNYYDGEGRGSSDYAQAAAADLDALPDNSDVSGDWV